MDRSLLKLTLLFGISGWFYSSQADIFIRMSMKLTNFHPQYGSSCDQEILTTSWVTDLFFFQKDRGCKSIYIYLGNKIILLKSHYFVYWWNVSILLTLKDKLLMLQEK